MIAINSEDLAKPAELEGSMAFLETGISLSPRENFSVDFSVFGMVGQQDGFGGTVGLRFDFLGLPFKRFFHPLVFVSPDG